MSSSPLSICAIQRDLAKGSGRHLPHPNTSHTLGETCEDDVGHLGGRRGRVKRRLETHEEGKGNARELSKKKKSPIGGHINRGRKEGHSPAQAMSISRQKGAKQGARRSNGRAIARNREARGGEIDRADACSLLVPPLLGSFGLQFVSREVLEVYPREPRA